MVASLNMFSVIEVSSPVNDVSLSVAAGSRGAVSPLFCTLEHRGFAFAGLRAVRLSALG